MGGWLRVRSAQSNVETVRHFKTRVENQIGITIHLIAVTLGTARCDWMASNQAETGAKKGSMGARLAGASWCSQGGERYVRSFIYEIKRSKEIVVWVR